MTMKLKCSLPAIAALLWCSISLFPQCSKEDAGNRGSAVLNVVLKDAPGLYEAVLVEVLEVQIHSTSAGWVSVDVQDSIYDLLLLQDSAIAVLGQTLVPADRISQIRLILGDDNSVQKDSVVYPLSMSSQDETGLKLNVNQVIQAGALYTLVLDFKAEESVIDQGNGEFRLKPVITAEFQ
jgi:hypothetical protein